MGDGFVFCRDQGHGFFPGRRRFLEDGHTWRQRIWSRYAKAPIYRCGLQKRMIAQYGSIRWNFESLLPHWPASELTIGPGSTYEELSKDVTSARCYTGSLQGQTLHLVQGFDNVSSNLFMF
jgi:hypothetical protein